jgi:dipeptidyl aminopeptidase/acylaminoacyl peptidase
MGHSAGGHLALLAALPAEAGAPSPVRAVVGCAPVSDFVSDMERRGGLSRSMQDLLALPAEPTPEAITRLRGMSPVTLLAAGYPPTLLLHGEVDKTVPLAQSAAFQERARALGVECELHVLPGAGHRLTQWAAHDPSWARVLTDWLRVRLGPARDEASGGVNNATPAPLPAPPRKV